MIPRAPDNLIRRLDEAEREFEHLSAQLLEGEVLSDHRRVRAISTRRSALLPLVEQWRQLRAAEHEVEQLAAVVRENADTDLVQIAREDLPNVEHHAVELLRSIQRLLVSAEDRAVGSIIVEIRAGVGGDEAGLWAGDLAEMYRRFAAARGWLCETMQASPGEAGGFKQVILRIEGDGVWAQLGYESGTHQVKRIPATETQGRVHTSTATVAILPEPEEIEVQIDLSDVKEMMTTAQGPGGQNVNKVATAVHLIHVPTGIEVRMQETKSQSQNRARAWQLLRARLFERQKAEREAQRAEARRGMIGSASRSEKIRTYRYKENVVVDHRLGSSAALNLGEIMAGRLDGLVTALAEQDLAERVAAL